MATALLVSENGHRRTIEPDQSLWSRQDLGHEELRKVSQRSWKFVRFCQLRVQQVPQNHRTRPNNSEHSDAIIELERQGRGSSTVEVVFWGAGEWNEPRLRSSPKRGGCSAGVNRRCAHWEWLPHATIALADWIGARMPCKDSREAGSWRLYSVNRSTKLTSNWWHRYGN